MNLTRLLICRTGKVIASFDTGILIQRDEFIREEQLYYTNSIEF